MNATTVKGGIFQVNGPTGGSSAPTADNSTSPVGLTERDDPFRLNEGVAEGDYLLELEPLETSARIKCAKCNMVTHHDGILAFSATETSEIHGSDMRIYCCTVCGVLTTKRA